MGQRVKDRGLSAHTLGIYIGPGVDVSPAIEEEASGIEEAIFGGDVEEGRATQREQAATGLAAIHEFRVSTVDQRWVGVKQGIEFGGAAAKDREDAWSIVARAGSGS